MKILITGGAGYVGSVVIPQLIKDGHHIKCLDRFFFGDEYLSQSQFSNNLELFKIFISGFFGNSGLMSNPTILFFILCNSQIFWPPIQI